MGIEGIIAARSDKSSIGFAANVKSKEDMRQSDVLKELQIEDIIKFGMIPEFIGRLPVVATLKELDKEALIKILTEPKNAIVKQYKKLFSLNNADLEFTPDALEAVATKALKRNTGARGLRSIIEELLLEDMYNFSELKNKIIIFSKETVENNVAAVIKPIKIAKVSSKSPKKRLAV